MPNTEHFEHGFIKTRLFKTEVEFVQFDFNNYFFFISTQDKVVEVMYNMMFPFELLFNDNIPKTNIQIQNITFNKSKLFRNYKKLNMFLYDFSTFENNIYKLNKFKFRLEFYKRLNLEGMYKYYGLCINGNFNNVLSWIYNKIKNDTV